MHNLNYEIYCYLLKTKLDFLSLAGVVNDSPESQPILRAFNEIIVRGDIGRSTNYRNII